MELYEKYITQDELKQYMGVETLPDNVEILISRASELVFNSVYMNYNSKNQKHVNAVKYATCAQVQNFIRLNSDGVTANLDSAISSYSLGDLSVSYDAKAVEENAKSSTSLCFTANRYLMSAHLLYRGVKF